MRAVPVVLAAMTLVLPGCFVRRPDGVTPPLEVHRVLGEVGNSPGQFGYPRALDYDGTFLWVIDKSARVQRIDPASGRCVGGWTMPEFILGKPTGVTIARGDDHDLLVYVPDTHYHRVVVYRMPPVAAPGVSVRDVFLPGQPPVVAEFGSYGEADGQFVYPTDVAVLMDDASGKVKTLYVTEYGGNDRVSMWVPDGKGGYAFSRSFGHFGSSSSADSIEFNRPQSIEIDRSRGSPELIISDACNHRIGRFTLDGALVAWIGSPETVGDGLGQFKYPYGLCCVGDGTALIAEFGNNRIQHIDLATGKGLGAYGGAGRLPGQVLNPWAVTLVGNEVFVLDSQNNRIVVTALPGVKSRRPIAGVTP